MVSRERQMSGDYIDAHHIVNPRLGQEIYKEGIIIRRTPSLIPRIERSAHNEIHRECPGLPVLSYFAIAQTLKYFEPTRDTLETMDNLMFAIETASKHRSLHPIERDVGYLAIEALEIQRPFIKDALSTRNL